MALCVKGKISNVIYELKVGTKKELSSYLKTIWYQKLLGFAKHAESKIQFNGFTDLHYRACKQEQLSETLSPALSRCFTKVLVYRR